MSEKELLSKIQEYLQHPLDPENGPWPKEKREELAAWLMEYAPGRYRMAARRLTLAPTIFALKDANISLENIARTLSKYGSVEKVQEAIPAVVEQTKEAIKQTDVIVTAAVQEPRAGRREDHESLPLEIKACYEENLPLLQLQRSKHEKMKLYYRQLLQQRSMANVAPCDIEETCHAIQQAAREVADLNDKRLRNWETYDHYGRNPKGTTDPDLNPEPAPKPNKNKFVGDSGAWLNRNLPKLVELADNPAEKVAFVKLRKEMQARVKEKEKTGWRAKKYQEMFDKCGIKYTKE